MSFKTFSLRHVASFDWLKCLNFQGDTCQQLIGSLMSLLTSVGCHCLHMLLCGMCRCLHALMCDWHFACFFFMFLFHDTWQIFVSPWMMMIETNCSTWRFVISRTLWTWYYDVSGICDRSGIFPLYTYKIVWGWVTSMHLWF